MAAENSTPVQPQNCWLGLQALFRTQGNLRQNFFIALKKIIEEVARQRNQNMC